MKQYIFVRDIKPYKKGEKVKLNNFFENYYLSKGVIQPTIAIEEKTLKKRKKGEKTK